MQSVNKCLRQSVSRRVKLVVFQLNDHLHDSEQSSVLSENCTIRTQIIAPYCQKVCAPGASPPWRKTKRTSDKENHVDDLAEAPTPAADEKKTQPDRQLTHTREQTAPPRVYENNVTKMTLMLPLIRNVPSSLYSL